MDKDYVAFEPTSPIARRRQEKEDQQDSRNQENKFYFFHFAVAGGLCHCRFPYRASRGLCGAFFISRMT